jgi:signal transduction histidine kinase
MVYDIENRFTSQMLSSWTGVMVSLLMLLSLAFVRRIFNIQQQLDGLRKENEARVLSAIIKTEEKERQHFAKELHDGLGPLLAAVKMAISSRRKTYEFKDQVIENAEKLIDESVLTLKEISNKLSPHILNNFGLDKAIHSFISNLKIIDKPKIKLKSNLENKRFSYNIEVLLYRVVCELLTNTLKHAEANNVYIDLLLEDHQIMVNYIDDGIGCPDYEQINGSGQGFTNIRSRIQSINGEYQFYSSPNEGIRVVISIHL